jgi:hypothetical protein
VPRHIRCDTDPWQVAMTIQTVLAGVFTILFAAAILYLAVVTIKAHFRA